MYELLHVEEFKAAQSVKCAVVTLEPCLLRYNCTFRHADPKSADELLYLVE